MLTVTLFFMVLQHLDYVVTSYICKDRFYVLTVVTDLNLFGITEAKPKLKPRIDYTEGCWLKYICRS